MSSSIPRRPAVPRDLYPFRSHYETIGGFDLHYLDEGQGDPVVMLHGNPTWSFYYREMVKALSPAYRTIVPDHIGCGLSEKPPADRYPYTLDRRIADLETLLHRLSIHERLTLIAHDWGGMIGMACAVRRPERIARIILMNTAAFFPPGDKGLPWRLWVVRNLTHLSAPAVLGLNLFARAALYMASRKGLPGPVKQGLIAPYDRPRNRIATLRFVQDIPTSPGDPSHRTVRRVAEGLHRLSEIPMLLLWGGCDFVFDTDYLAEWRRRFPNAQVHLFPDAGHYVMEDAAGGAVSRTQDFLKNHPI